MDRRSFIVDRNHDGEGEALRNAKNAQLAAHRFAQCLDEPVAALRVVDKCAGLTAAGARCSSLSRALPNYVGLPSSEILRASILPIADHASSAATEDTGEARSRRWFNKKRQEPQ